LNSKATWFALSGISIPFGERAGEFRYRLFSQYIERLPIPNASDGDKMKIGELAKGCNSLGPQIYGLQAAFQKRLTDTFATSPSQKLNEKSQDWAELSLSELGAGLRTSFKLSDNPFKNPRTADQWEPYLAEKKAEVDRLSRQLADAEAELNDRVYRLFDLTPDEIRLLQKEVEH
jgi:hypothetical protein